MSFSWILEGCCFFFIEDWGFGDFLKFIIYFKWYLGKVGFLVGVKVVWV